MGSYPCAEPFSHSQTWSQRECTPAQYTSKRRTIHYSYIKTPASGPRKYFRSSRHGKYISMPLAQLKQGIYIYSGRLWHCMLSCHSLVCKASHATHVHNYVTFLSGSKMRAHHLHNFLPEMFLVQAKWKMTTIIIYLLLWYYLFIYFTTDFCHSNLLHF